MRVLAVMSDLMFKSRVMVAAKNAGADISFVTSPEDAVAKASATAPDLVVLDLMDARAWPVAAALKTVAPAARYVGYFAHVEGAIADRAKAAGVEAISHGAFVGILPQLLSTPG